MSNFASHSAFCERKIKLCEVCDEPVQISDFKEHEEEYHAMVACEMCDAALQKWMLPKHQVCNFCIAAVQKIVMNYKFYRLFIMYQILNI